MEKLLKSIYYNQKNSGSYSGVRNLYRQAIEKDPSITLKQVKEFLAKQLPYTLHYPRRNKFPRNKIIVNKMNEQWEADLVDMSMFSRQNAGYKYILTVIDCFSKVARVQAVKSKTAENIKNAFKLIFQDNKPLNLRTDRGLEFMNSVLKKYLKELNINHFTSNDEKIKCAIVERFNRTLKSRMFKYFTAKGTRKYIKVLQDFVTAYNNSYHRTIKMKPIDVKINNEDQVFRNIYDDKSFNELINPRVPNPQLKTGDKVRIPYESQKLDKGYYPTYKDHVFTVERPIKGDKKYVFKIKDYKGNIINQVFYPEQLQKITENLHRVEKILKKRTRRGIKEVFVKWTNYPPTYNSWIPEKDVQDLRL